MYCGGIRASLPVAEPLKGGCEFIIHYLVMNDVVDVMYWTTILVRYRACVKLVLESCYSCFVFCRMCCSSQRCLPLPHQPLQRLRSVKLSRNIFVRQYPFSMCPLNVSPCTFCLQQQRHLRPFPSPCKRSHHKTLRWQVYNSWRCKGCWVVWMWMASWDSWTVVSLLLV